MANALRHHISIIQGPPGTGKTSVCAAIVFQMSIKKPKEKTLCVGQSNIGVDNLAERIAKTGLNVVRVLSRTQELESRICEKLCLHYRLIHDDLDMPEQEDYRNLMSIKKDIGHLPAKYNKIMKRIEPLLIKAVFERAHVICSTCVTCLDSRLDGMSYGFMLMDEAT